MRALFGFFLVAIAICLSQTVFAESLKPLWVATGFQTPESVIYDNQNNLIFVSNINGRGDEKNGKGFISKLNLDGSIVKLKWVEGLNAPKGLAIVGNTLYTADIDQLVEINISSGQIIKRYSASKAKLLNDVAADSQGNIYVSDMITDTLYRLSEGKFASWIKDPSLESPNGLYIDGNDLIVGSWGILTDGIKTNVPGHLKKISLVDPKILSLGDGSPVGNLDGVEADGEGNFYVTDWMQGVLYKINANGKAETLLTLAQGAADLDVIMDKKLLLIPMMIDNKLMAFTIE